MSNTSEKVILKKLVDWANSKPDIRALFLTSSRTNPNKTIDDFSDYDIIMAVNDIQPYIESNAWLECFGSVLTVYKDPTRLEYGYPSIFRVTHYNDFTKIDYTIWPVDLLKHIVKMPDLPDYLDDGYKILLDKSGLTAGMKPPRYKAYIPKPPTEGEYLQAINTFYSDSTYVGKNLYRDNLFIVKECLDHVMKFHYIRLMFEWLMEIENGWTVKTGAYGKGLKKRTKTELWAELEKTYCGASKKENWQALFKTIELFSKVAREVGVKLGFRYPEEIEQNIIRFLEKIRQS